MRKSQTCAPLLFSFLLVGWVAHAEDSSEIRFRKSQAPAAASVPKTLKRKKPEEVERLSSGRGRSYRMMGGYLAQDFLRETRESLSGDRKTQSPTYIWIGGSIHFPLGSRFDLGPELGFTPFGSEGEAATFTRSVFTAFAPLSFRLSGDETDPDQPLLRLRLSPGIVFYRIKGSGGTVLVDNGTGKTVFGKPSDSSTSRVLVTALGLDARIRGAWIFGANGWLLAPLTNRRSANLLLSLGYEWGRL